MFSGTSRAGIVSSNAQAPSEGRIQMAIWTAESISVGHHTHPEASGWLRNRRRERNHHCSQCQQWASERKRVLHIFKHNHGGISVWVETTLDYSWERNLDTWKRKSMFWSCLLWTELMNLLTDSSTDGFLLIYLFEGCHGLAWRWFEAGLTGEP